MSNPNTSRRRFLAHILSSLLTASLGLLVAIPALGYLCAPLMRKSRTDGGDGGFMDVGPVSDLPVGEWRLLALEVMRQDGWEKSRSRQSVWVRRHSGPVAGITVLTPLCPHLGCPVNWQADQSHFICPCHRAIFDAAGVPVSGPVLRSLDPLETEVRDGRLWVRWQDFKIGIAERIATSA